MPSLSLHALKQHITSRQLAPVYLFVGEDTKLMDRMVGGVEAVIDEADRPFACERLYAGDDGGSPADIVSSSRMLPMLGDRRIVVVMRAERLLKPKRAGKAAAEEDEEAGDGGDAEAVAVDAGPIEEYLASPVPSTTLVFVASGHRPRPASDQARAREGSGRGVRRFVRRRRSPGRASAGGRVAQGRAGSLWSHDRARSRSVAGRTDGRRHLQVAGRRREVC